MRLLRVEVPKFRALENVVIDFEPDFTPQVFPLGSLNGGGKSTLLQLIFVLLHGFSNNASYLLENFIRSGVDIDNITEETYNLASITILDNKGFSITLDYHFCRTYLVEDLEVLLTKGGAITHTVHTVGLDVVQSEIFSEDIVFNFTLLGIANTDEKNIFNIIKEYVYLISPPNQSYLFLSREERRLLFSSNPEKTYDQVLKGLKDSLPNFYTYDFIDVLIEVCRLERDKDFDEKLKTGIYGTHYEKLENTINNLFIDEKKIIPLTVQQKRHTKDSIQSMGFKLPSGKEIYPEDLSHGELKRLAIFALLKYHDIQDSIILMDEIENGFHLDWQYTIVRNLVEWGKNNQYILATHSYELCTAVTPAHVKEIEPKLTTK
jgi:energy-coupling factor transporter ATP-binding protein EcfA2